MYKDLYDAEFDFVVFGTSLTESTLTAYLSKMGKKVLVIEIAASYGGDCKNFNLREFEKFTAEAKASQSKDSMLKQFKLLNRVVYTEDVTKAEDFRNYNFDLNPKFIYAKSKSTEELSSSKAANYLEFSSVKNVFFYYQGKLMNVPFSKSEIFTSQDLDLLEKQKLLAFLYSIMKIKNKEVDVNSTTDIQKDYELDNAILSTLQSNLTMDSSAFLRKNFSEKIQAMIMLILANTDPNCKSSLNVDEMITRIYKFLLSLQIYDSTPFLYPSYGSSEFTQALCRLGAVYGAIFLVNDQLKVQVNSNKEDKAYRYSILFTDEENKQSFTLKTTNIAVNEIYMTDLSASVQFDPALLIKREGVNKKKLLKFICFASIRNVTELRKNNGIVYYKIMKTDELLNNCYGFTSIEFFPNCNSAPKNRSLLHIYINSDEEANEDTFIEKCKGIVDGFIKRRLEEIEKEIRQAYAEGKEKDKKELKERLRFIEVVDEDGNELKLEEEPAKDEPFKEPQAEKEKEPEEKKEDEVKAETKEQSSQEPQAIEEEKKKEEAKQIEEPIYMYNKPKKEEKEKMKLSPSVLLQYELLQVVNERNHDIIQSNDKMPNVFITKNDFVDIDLDFYYTECESIVKTESIAQGLQEVPLEQEKMNKSNVSEDTDLINELFNSLSLPNEPTKPESEETKDKETSSEADIGKPPQ